MMSNQPNKRHPNKRGAARLPIVIFTVLALIILTIIIAAVAFLNFYRPNLDTDDPPFVVDNVTTDDTADTADASEDDTTAEDDTKYNRNTDVVNFLLVGQDLKSWKTDVMMLVNFNMAEGSLSIMQIPRDTYVNSTEDGVRGKINNLMYKKSKAAYEANSSPTVTDRVKAGMEGAVEFLESKLCVKIDGYALVNLEGFRNVIEIIGGVSVNVPYDMKYDDPAQNLHIDLKAGPQVLNGEQAEMFVRFRSGLVQGDIGRGNAQKIFLTALFKKLTESINISTIPKLAGEAIKYVTTNVELADIIYYVKELAGVDMEKVSFMTLPGDAPNTSHYVMRRADVLGLVNRYFNVYNKDITDEMFDTDYNFTDSTDTAYHSLYMSPATEVTVYNAAEIDEEGIHIPLIQSAQ